MRARPEGGQVRRVASGLAMWLFYVLAVIAAVDGVMTVGDAETVLQQIAGFLLMLIAVACAGVGVLIDGLRS